MPPYITPAKSHDYLACMGCDMTRQHDQVSDDCPQSAPMYFVSGLWPTASYRFLPDHAQDVISDHCEFQDQFVGFKVSDE